MLNRIFRFTPLVLTIFSHTKLVQAACECGYTIAETGAYFTNSILSDFSTSPDTSDLGGSSNFSSSWQASNDTINASDSDSLARFYDPSNVWIEDGTLKLRQIAYTPANAAAKDTVDAAAILTNADDIMYGSFRTTLKVDYDSSATNQGFVSGWFFYRDDSNEIDIETLGVDANDDTYHYTCQPASGKDQSQPVPWTAYQEQRFDWSRTKAMFYQNGKKAWQTTEDVPTQAGSMRLNLWANNNSYSGMPSSSNVTTSVKSFQLYYNTTSSNAGTDSVFKSACKAAGGKSTKTVCSIKDEVAPNSAAESTTITPPRQSTPTDSVKSLSGASGVATHSALLGTLTLLWFFIIG